MGRPFHRLLSWKPLSPHSLQFRLTLELLLLVMVGIGGIATWAGWHMEQALVSAHKQNLKYIAMNFLSEPIVPDRPAEVMERQIEQAIARFSTPELRIWVRSPSGQILGRSVEASSSPLHLASTMAMTTAPAQPTVFQLNDRYVVLCSNPIALGGMWMGQVYLLKDITEDHQRLTAGVRGLVLSSLVTVAGLGMVLAGRIRRALHPLEHMSRVAGALSADDLSGAKLELDRAPAEILGLATAFNEMLMRLSSSWDQQRQFVGNVSHELRTPLAVIAGYLQSLLRRGENLSPHQQQAVAIASAEAERTIRMLQDLLDLARADSGHLHFRLTPTMLNTLVAEVVQMSQKVSHRQIHLALTDEDVMVCVDPDRLQQVLINLVDNALKYSDANQAVDVVLEKNEQQALIHVCDRGIGIALAHQQRIFERFYRVDEAMTRSRDGTGLGLAIAKSLVEGMQGRIALRSKLGEGSLFTVTLPLWKPSP
ncbi:MAG TPA: two-component sensor histidine kinase [Cyanobacteria bacterium UBA8156]|nr:two-component sensor histidine kinase [Cyanobacteria bacterium UBA8156]